MIGSSASRMQQKKDMSRRYDEVMGISGLIQTVGDIVADTMHDWQLQQGSVGHLGQQRPVFLKVV